MSVFALSESDCLTSDLLSEERFSVESISFSGGAHDSEVVELCGSKVRLWKPTGAVSDTTLEELDPQGAFLAMVKELKGWLRDCFSTCRFDMFVSSSGICDTEFMRSGTRCHSGSCPGSHWFAEKFEFCPASHSGIPTILV